ARKERGRSQSRRVRPFGGFDRGCGDYSYYISRYQREREVLVHWFWRSSVSQCDEWHSSHCYVWIGAALSLLWETMRSSLYPFISASGAFLLIRVFNGQAV